jgi:type IV pilus assembly protein PilM
MAIKFNLAVKKAPNLGLELNSQSISIVKLEQTKRGLEVTKFASMSTPVGAVREGLIADPELAGQSVRELLTQAGYGSKQNPVVTMAVPGQSVVIRLMPVPTGMPADELEDVIRQEASNHVPFPLEDANLDWAVMPGTQRQDPDGVEREDVILSAVQKNIIDGYWNMAASAGIKLSKLDLTSLSVVRSLNLAKYLHADRLTMSVNIRCDATDISLLKTGMPLFNRTVLLGYDQVIEAISRNIDIGVDEVNKLIPDIPLVNAPAPDPRLTAASQIAKTVIGDIVDEVGRSIDFYRSQVGDVAIDQLVLTGPAAVLPQLDRFVATRLNFETVIANPLREVIYDTNVITDELKVNMSTLVGLVTRPEFLEMPTVELNLNKGGPSPGLLEGAAFQAVSVGDEDIETPWFLPALGGGAAACFVVLGIWGFITQFDVPKKQADLAATETDIENLKKQLKNLPKVQEETRELAEKKAVLKGIVDEGRGWVNILETIRTNSPQGIQVSKVKLSSNGFSIDGQAIDFTKVSHFGINLASSPYIEASNIAWAKRNAEDMRIVDFSIACKARAGSKSDDRLPSMAKKPQVLDFFAEWCGPCKQLKPVLEDMKKQFSDKVEFVTIDVDNPSNKSMVDNYKVRAVPSLFFLDSEGKVVKNLVGFDGAEPILSALKRISQEPAAKPQDTGNTGNTPQVR